MKKVLLFSIVILFSVLVKGQSIFNAANDSTLTVSPVLTRYIPVSWRDGAGFYHITRLPLSYFSSGSNSLVTFYFDSTQFRGGGTGVSPFRLTNRLTAGSCSNCNFSWDSTGLVLSAQSAGGGVGPFLYLPTQSSLIPTPVGGINVADSGGFTWVRPDNFRRTINWQTVTVNRTATFPDTSFIAAGQNIVNNYSVGQIISYVGTNHLTLQNGTGIARFTEASGGGLTLALSGGSFTVPNTTTSNLNTGSGSVMTFGGNVVLKRTQRADVSFTASGTGEIIEAYSSLTATRAVTAPTSPTTGMLLIIADEAGTAGTNNITFVGTLDGSVNPVLVNTNHGCRVIYYTGSAWQTISKF